MGLETDWEPACLKERGGCGERRAGILAGPAPSRCVAQAVPHILHGRQGQPGLPRGRLGSGR